MIADQRLRTAKEGVLSESSLVKNLGMFAEVYEAGTPEQQATLLQMQISVVVWRPDRLEVGYYDRPPLGKGDGDGAKPLQFPAPLRPAAGDGTVPAVGSFSLTAVQRNSRYGSPARTRTWNLAVNSRSLYH